MKRILLFSLLFPLLTEPTSAQVTRGLWEYGPVITTTNNAYGWFAENVKSLVIGSTGEKGIDFCNRNRWWIPSFRARFDVLKTIDSPNGDIKVKWWDWGVQNISVGYHIGYLSYIYPIGFDFQIDYEKQNWKLKVAGQDDYKSYDKQMVVPTLLLKTRIGDFTSKKFNVIVEAGAKYNYVFRVRGDYSDSKSISNGFSGVLGLGVINSFSHISLLLRYEHDFFNYFNPGYIAYGGYKPYEGVKSKHGTLNLYTSFGF